MNVVAPDSLVVDASVVLKWVLPEPGRQAALELRDLAQAGDCVLRAPAHWVAEVGNVVWVRARGGEATRPRPIDAAADLASLLAAPIISQPLDVLSPLALEIATDADVTFYDALYVAAAARLGVPLVTADRRLVERLAASAWSGIAVPLAV